MGATTTLSNVVGLAEIPRATALAPTCKVGLLEVAARIQFGCRTIERSWFSHSFVFTPFVVRSNAVDGDGAVSFDLTVTARASELFSNKLARYYGLAYSVGVCRTFSELVESMVKVLSAGGLPLTSFDSHFATGSAGFGKGHALNYVLPCRLDGQRQLVGAVDAHAGPLSITMRDYEQCFDYLQTCGLECRFITCHRVDPSPVDDDARRILAEDLLPCLANLRSPEPNLGLNGLRAGVARLQARLEIDEPCHLASLSRFHRERHSTARHLDHWRVLLPHVTQQIDRVADLIKRSGGSWYRIHMAMVGSTLGTGSRLDRKCLPTLQRILELEAAIADAFEDLARAVG
jgi:hypothetical protein